MARANDLNDIRTRLLVIVGHANNIEVMLGQVNSTDKIKVGYVDHCTDSILRELQRLSHVLSQEIEEANAT